METMEAEIKEHLMAFLDAIKASNSEELGRRMEKLDALLERGRGSLHPQLVHFLEKRSYAKAAMFLGGESDIPAGICGGRAGRGAAN